MEIGQAVPFPLLQDLIKLRRKRRRWHLAGQTQIHHPLISSRDGVLKQQGRLGSFLLWIHRCGIAIDHIAVECILHIRLLVGLAVKALRVGLIFCEQPRSLLPANQLIGAKTVQISGFDTCCDPLEGVALTPCIAVTPVPGVTHPEGREQGQGSCIRATIDDADANQHIFGAGLGVINNDIEIAIIIKNACFNQLVFRFIAAPAAVFFHQMLIREFLLGVFVEPAHEAMGGGIQQMKKVILDVLPMIPLTIAQSEGSLLQDRILAIPQCDAKAKETALITDAQQTIFAPAIGA